MKENDPSHSTPHPFVAWPSAQHLVYGWGAVICVSIVFIIIYGGADYFASLQPKHFSVHFAWELSIPFVPIFTAGYMSVYLLFWSAPIVLRKRGEINRLVINQILIILVAGCAFLLFPAKNAFPPISDQDLGVYKAMFRLADTLNLDYNMAPSLHVALSLSCIIIYSRSASKVVKACLHGWSAIIAAATLLIHQHHIVDVAGGYALAFGITWCVDRIYTHKEGTQCFCVDLENGSARN
jgi:membrane-associated phospholipid phosphatase